MMWNMINGQRLWDRLMQLGTIGRTEDGGITRLSFTPEDREAKNLVQGYMVEAGLEVREDSIGNLIGRREGREEGREAVLLGSHLDTVFNGGAFDGALGVLGAVEVAQTLFEQNIQLTHPLEVIAFTDEEGARFRAGMMGSRAFSGVLEKEDLERQDGQNHTLEEVLKANGYDPEAVCTADRSQESFKAYLELHVEQGRVLEEEGAPVGIVTGIAGPLWLQFQVQGETGHAGATPMPLRKDALVAAASIIKDIEEQTRKTGTAVGTVGSIHVQPGGINIIPGQATFTLDLRDTKAEVRDQVEKDIRDKARTICAKNDMTVAIKTLQRIPPVECAPELQNVLRRVMENRRLKVVEIATGAAHDGNQMSRICPVGMIFVRSRNGISHAPQEWSSQEDCAEGANVLLQALLEIAE